MGVIEITYFSDILCIWAYASQARIHAVKEQFGNDVLIKNQFCSVFGDTAGKIKANWDDKGGYDGFNAHLRQVAERFPHISVHSEIWLETRPRTSASVHLFMKAVELSVRGSELPQTPSAESIINQILWAFRCAFFRDCLDIARWDIQCDIALSFGADIAAIKQCIDDGIAFAHLMGDYQEADKMKIEGSPSFVLNSGRQKLYGNIGFRLLEANIQELLRAPRIDEASWC